MAINPKPKFIFSRRCWIEGQLQPATLVLQKNKIIDVVNSMLPACCDYGDAVIMPGGIDAHTHINEPGRTHWEGFDSATKAAAAGGITTIVDMPLNSSPVTINKIAFEQKLEAAKSKLHVNVGFYGGLVPDNINELNGLINAGVLGIKCFLTHSGIDEFPNVNFDEVADALEILHGTGVPLLAHCELSDNNSFPPIDFTTYLDYMHSRPDVWETNAINGMIALCSKYNTPIHIVHVSSALSLPIIEAAKKTGLPITAETCAHYLFFSSENIPDKQPIYKCAPPIRTEENNKKLKLALQTGLLDFITSDHSPAPPEMKELESGNLAKAWGGIAGLQFLLPASFTALRNEIPLENFIPLLTEKPASFIGVQRKKGYLKPGYDADITVWSPEEKFFVEMKDILHRHKQSPYVGRELYGKIISTIVQGEKVFDNNRILFLNAGKWVLKK
ncbi:MAG: allantoinase AllB [Ferruginibacter sp.]|nr:allantoinase AllB [Ferruginibacter sp.]